MQYEVLRSHHGALHTCIAQTRLQQGLEISANGSENVTIYQAK